MNLKNIISLHELYLKIQIAPNNIAYNAFFKYQMKIKRLRDFSVFISTINHQIYAQTSKEFWNKSRKKHFQGLQRFLHVLCNIYRKTK